MVTLTYDELIVQGVSYLVAATTAGLTFVGSPNSGLPELKQWFPEAQLKSDPTDLATTEQEVREYLAGHRRQFDIPIDLQGGTALQRQVWSELRHVRYGQRVTYSELAVKVGHPTAIRAVATAVAKNPLLMVIPCHRVIRKDGSLGNYRGGVAMKNDLLKLETQFSETKSF